MAAGSGGTPGAPGGTSALWSVGAMAPTSLVESWTSAGAPAPGGGAQAPGGGAPASAGAVPGAGTVGGDGSGGPAASGSRAAPSFPVGTGSGGMNSPGMNPSYAWKPNGGYSSTIKDQ